MRSCAWVFLPVMLAGCQEARMEGFSAVAAVGETVALVGAGGWVRGDFGLSDGSAAGRFRRGSEQRTESLGVAFDADADATDGAALVAARSRLAFTLDGARVGGRIDGSCRGEREDDRLRAGPVTLVGTARPLLIRCRFERDGRDYGELTLRAVQVPGPEIVEPVAGSLRFGGRELAVESEHRVEGVRGAVEEPIGYRFVRADGGVAGAVERNGGTRMALAGGPEERVAVVVAGVALGLMWMPQGAE